MISTLNYTQANYLSHSYNFTVGSGILADLTQNSIALSLDHSEVRPSLHLASGGGFKTLQATGNYLMWDSELLATTGYAQANFLSPLGDMVTPGFIAHEGLTASLSANSIGLYLNYTEVRPALYLESGTGFKTLAANGDDLQWGGNKLATSIDLGSKQDTLVNYTETVGATTTIAQYFDDNPVLSTHIAWSGGPYTNVANSHQEIPISGAGLGVQFGSLGTGTCHMSIELRADTCNEAVFSINNVVGWTFSAEIKFSDLSSTSWTTCTWSFPIPSNGAVNFHVGSIPPGSSLTQASGIIHLKNLRLFRTAASATISSQLNCAGDIICNRSVTATSFTSTSDQAIKENVQNASLEDCTRVLREVDVKTYTRTDVPGPRIGFIAQDLQQHLPPEFANIMGMQYGDRPLLALSYDRLVCVLWGACKALTARVDALELAQ